VICEKERERSFDCKSHRFTRGLAVHLFLFTPLPLPRFTNSVIYPVSRRFERMLGMFCLFSTVLVGERQLKASLDKLRINFVLKFIQIVVALFFD
jgi:hypothetical protein